MKPCFYERFAGFYFAGDTFTDSPLCSQCDQSSVGTLSVMRFDGLNSAAFIGFLPRVVTGSNET